MSSPVTVDEHLAHALRLRHPRHHCVGVLPLELNHNFVGTEHLLLALTRDPDALVTRILTAHQISDAEIRTRVAELVPEGTTAT